MDPIEDHSTSNPLGFNFNLDSDSEFPNLSILHKVKTRLGGIQTQKDEDTNETQRLPQLDEETQIVSTPVFQRLPQLTVDEDDYNDQTQKVSTPVFQRLPQLTVDEDDYNDQTQVIPKSNITQTQVVNSNLNNLFISDDEENNEILSSQQKEAKLQRLIQEKKRLRKLQQEKLEAELTKQSISDEENEMNQEVNNSVISSNGKDGVSIKELEKAQEFLNIQKRQIDIKPTFATENKFTKDKFIQLFSDEEDTPQVEIQPPSSPTIQELLKSSPITSPIKDTFDLFNRPTNTQSKHPLHIYAEKLKNELLSSPESNKTGKKSKLINLDSESEIELASSSPTKKFPGSKFSNHAHELDRIPELTKEQRLTIKQKFLKKKFDKKQGQKKVNLHHGQDFIQNLRLKNINQLKLEKSNNPDHAILEEIEKDDESMTSLLEREIERNKQIRRKEKLQERAKLELINRALSQKDHDYELHESEIDESEVPDSEYDSEENEEEVDTARSDDSYMFGGNKDSQEEQTIQNNDEDQETQVLLNDSFDNGNTVSGLPQFNDLTQTQSLTQTQVDTQNDISPTQNDTSITQVINPIVPEDDEDDIVTPARVKRGKKKIQHNMISIEEEENEKEEESEESLQEKIKMYELKIRKQELQKRKKRKEMERKGLKSIVEGEAEESEDEWKGLGGIDGEISDVENSEDERMIDNNWNIDLNDEAIKAKFMEDYKIKDQKELEKLLNDIKNHRLLKKSNYSNLDIELSDEEDRLLNAYRKQKILEQQQRLLSNKKLQKLTKNEKCKAFFDCIQDSNNIVRIDSESEEEKEASHEEEEPDSLEKEPIKKTIRIEESFVQKKLSFLNSVDQDDYENVQKLSRFQHGLSDSEDDNIQQLKTKSMTNLNTNESVIGCEEDLPSLKREFSVVSTDDDEDDEFLPTFKRPSMVKSFKSFQDQQSVLIKDGKQSESFSGVTISKQYKVVSGSKASISSMTNRQGTQTKQFKSLKERKIEEKLNKLHNNKLFNNTFE